MNQEKQQRDRRARRRTATALLVCLALAPAGLVSAALKVQGKGKEQTLVRDQFAADQQGRYDMFQQKCARCHELARPISALLNGVTPLSADKFDEEGIKKYVVKMMRKPNSGIVKEEARELIHFLTYARSLATK
jgi:mono/diheme cytochrome c family protein